MMKMSSEGEDPAQRTTTGFTSFLPSVHENKGIESRAEKQRTTTSYSNMRGKVTAAIPTS